MPNQRGFTPILLLLLAAIGVIIYILVTSTFPFKDKLFSLLFPKPPSHAQQVSESVSDEILVKFKPGVSEKAKQNIENEHTLEVLETIPQIDVLRVKVTTQSKDAVIEALNRNPLVEFAEPNFIVKSQFSPNDQFLTGGLQWAPAKISALSAWDITQGSPNITIAILDCGVYVSHPDLVAKVLTSVDFSGSTSTNDVCSHGTHVAGIAGAATNNSIGVAGIGFNSTLDNVKVLGDTGGGTTATLTNGIIWAADHGAKVINMSLGGKDDSNTAHSAVDYAWSKGLVLVAAAGNNGSNTPFYPAAYPNVIGVAATNSSDQLLPSSDYGSWVKVAAPGGQIYSTVNSGSYQALDGTSMASPHVAAEAALILAANPNLSNQQVVDIITSTADNIGITGIGSGRINVGAALQKATGIIPSPTPTPAPSDITPPTVSITNPTDGGTVKANSKVNITASASDNISVSKVEFYVGTSLICTDTVTPYTCTWSVPGKKGSAYTITVKAYDTVNNSNFHTITVKAQ